MKKYPISMCIKLYRLCKSQRLDIMSIRLWVLNLVSSYQQVILIRPLPVPWGMNFWTPQTGKMGDGWQYTYTG